MCTLEAWKWPPLGVCVLVSWLNVTTLLFWARLLRWAVISVCWRGVSAWRYGLATRSVYSVWLSWLTRLNASRSVLWSKHLTMRFVSVCVRV